MRIFYPGTAPRFINRRTGREIYLTSVINGVIWGADEENGTKNFWKPSVFDKEFKRIWDGNPNIQPQLCAHCGFLQVDKSGTLCGDCRDRFQ